MLLQSWKAASRMAAMLAMLCTSLVAQAQAVGGEEPTGQIHAASEVEPERRFGMRDEDYQRLSKKQQTELIRLVAYTDEEWAALEQAVIASLKACDTGDGAACHAAGDAYALGEGVWQFTPIATILYKEACDADVGAGCRSFAELAYAGSGDAEGGPQETEGLMERACDLGDWIACDTIASGMRETDDAAGADAFLTRSKALSERACEAGDNEACLFYSGFLADSDSPEDQTRATGMVDDLCRKSLLEACEEMVRLVTGRPEPDEALAGQYQRLACDLGSATDCIDMAYRAFEGKGVTKDWNLALADFDKGCDLDGRVCYLRSYARVIPLARRGCEAGDSRACAGLGKALLVDSSFTIEQAIALFQESCRKGPGDACFNGADIITVPTDQRRALLALLEAGCDAGNDGFCLELASEFEATDLGRAIALYIRLCDANFAEACLRESRYAGYFPGARIAPADDRFISPWPEDNLDNFRDYINTEVCFTVSEEFRGTAYSEFRCDVGEKGIGSLPAQPGQAPWQALIWRPESLAGNRLSPGQRVLCGGSLIAPGWVLTAAHCLSDNGTRVGASGHRIRLGVYNPHYDEGISYPILRAIPHPQYNKSNRYLFDIALVQFDHRAGKVGADVDLSAPARALPNVIASIALDPLNLTQRKILKGTPVYSFGWGWTELENSTSTDYLQVVKMETVSEGDCTALTKFTGALANAALCAGGKDREQTCFGDSGGPLVLYSDNGRRPVLIGVVSAGKKCGTTGLPSQYTRVAKVRGWIDSHVAGAR
jgi:TPR repeat protein